MFVPKMPRFLVLVWILVLIPGLFIGVSSAAEPFARETPVVRAVRMASPAVVNINTKSVVTQRSPFGFLGRGGDPFEQFFRDFFIPQEREMTYTSLGSGVIIDGKKGLILTNEHVVTRASEIRVSLADEREFTAEVIGSDPDSDLAVLKIDTKEMLPSLPVGDSSDLMIGETVIAIGNPFGLTHTVTTGVISALNRSVKAEDRVYRDFIQTDASINPGNSGGPLLNINGELIGVNSAIYYKAEGIGFAIPINKAKRIIKDLISYGEVHPAWLGLSLQSLDERLAQYFGVPVRGGVVVTQVDPDGPAAKAGLKKGDVIIKIGRNTVRSLDEYEDLIKSYTHGDQVDLNLYRGKRRQDISVRAQSFPVQKAESIGWNIYGLRVKDYRKTAVIVDSVRTGSPAHEIGLREGDFLLRINEIKIESKSDYIKAMTRYRLRNGISAVVQRGNRAYHITLRP